jgi:hypothetical protein
MTEDQLFTLAMTALGVIAALGMVYLKLRFDRRD